MLETSFTKDGNAQIRGEVKCQRKPRCTATKNQDIELFSHGPFSLRKYWAELMKGYYAESFATLVMLVKENL